MPVTRSHRTASFATSIHPSGHYFLDQYGNPHLMAGSSEQTWTNLSVSDIQFVMQTRAAQGFNWEHLGIIASQGDFGATGTPDWANVDNIVPFFQSDGTTLGTGPANYDVTKPNTPYWTRIDVIFQTAQTCGITLLVDLIDSDYQSNGGFFVAQGATKLATYATWFATRYAGFTYHHLWSYDHFTTKSGGWAATDTHITAMLNAVRAVNPRCLHTIENNDGLWTTQATTGAALDLTSDDTTWTLGHGTGQMDFNALYTAEDNCPDFIRGYNLGAPVFFVEGFYDGSAGTYPTTKNNWSNLLNRKYLYYPMVNGAAGSFYGHTTGWAFPSGWQSTFTTTAVTHCGLWSAFMKSIAWWSLVPDQANTFVTSGQPTAGFPYSTRFGVNAAVAADGSLGLVYLAANQSVTVAMTKMTHSGTVVARWFDPTNGTYTAIGSFANTGTHVFTSSTNNAAGDPDWVLVLTA